MKRKKKPILTEDEIKQIEDADVVMIVYEISLEDLKKLKLIDSRILSSYLRKQDDKKDEVE